MFVLVKGLEHFPIADEGNLLGLAHHGTDHADDFDDAQNRDCDTAQDRDDDGPAQQHRRQAQQGAEHLDLHGLADMELNVFGILCRKQGDYDSNEP